MLTDPGLPSHLQTRQAARTLRAGGLIAYPTEAVFGLGCDPGNPDAVARLLALKQRPASKGLILVASRWEQLLPWVGKISAAQKKRLFDTWPGPYTWLLPAAPQCPSWLTGRHATLAVRISAHPPVEQLCEVLQQAIVSTSANLSGQLPARTVLQTRLRLGTAIDYLLPGEVGHLDKPTSIRDLASGTVHRN